jgi:hypothetical protein
LIKKEKENFSAVFFFKLLVVQPQDPYPDSPEMLDPDLQHCLATIHPHRHKADREEKLLSLVHN